MSGSLGNVAQSGKLDEGKKQDVIAGELLEQREDRRGAQLIDP